MFLHLRNRVAMIVCGIITASGVATGVFASCDGNYCDVDTADCTPLNSTFQASCCRPTSNGSHCMTCTRRWYWCYDSAVAGSAYNCSGAGAFCS